ncbi:MAG TPA: error-prone DNA polymerase [Gammaproteobacteria bacterium]|nr:error-prone DNA polymerase [Gammaproteobacteria bacterium]
MKHRGEALPEYAELHALSNFSFLRGASHPAELVTQAATLGYRALALTDECSVAGLVRAHVAAKEAGLPLIAGSEIRLVDDTRLVLLARNRRGYGSLCALITRGRRAAEKGDYRLTRDDLGNGVPECLALWLPGAYPAHATGTWLREVFGERVRLATELLLTGQDRRYLTTLQRIGVELDMPLVASGDVHMHVPERRRLQDTLTAIRLRRPLAEIRGALFPNAERHLRTRARLARIYPPELLRETCVIAGQCHFSPDELRYEYPEEVVPAGRQAAAHLRALVYEGAGRRWPGGIKDSVKAQIEKELALIGELHYEHYFLTVHDIVRFARSREILCQGRGSAANSAVCFCLGITELDPASSNLLFERFISRERDEPPDIDVDFEHERREEVIQYLYRKYGRERAALAATLITYRPRSAVRDVGKALGLNQLQVDRLAGAFQWWDDSEANAARIREAGLDPDSPVIRRLMELVNTLLGFPRHLSQHVGGFVLSRGPLCEMVPVENAAMPERTVIQWDKDDLDAIGLLKVDVLALGMLSALRRTLTLVNRLRHTSWTLADVPQEDPDVYRMIRRADTIGVFQIESRAQMSMLPRLQPRCFYDLVIEVAIVRPGPIQGDMVHPYLARRSGREPVTYPSPEVKQVLERTLGVPIFQEQVMQLAMVAAGFTPGEADQLRRAMAAWRRKGGLEPFERRLTEGMRERGYSDEFAQQIFRQIQGFGEYGFPESHSASFALLAYVSAWFKCHEPAAFTCALLNSQPMGFYAPAQLVADARRHGVEVQPVDVNASDWECTLDARENETQPAIRFGLLMIKGVSETTGRRIVTARRSGAFESIADLTQRAALDRAALQVLAASGALSGLAGHRRRAQWAALGMEAPLPLGAMPVPEALPLLATPGEGDDIVADYASVGVTLGRHPLALLRTRLAAQRVRSAETLATLRNGMPVRVAGLVTHRQRPGSAKGVTFVTLEDETGQVNVVVWPALAERQRNVLLRSRLLGVTGTVQHEDGVLHVVAGKLTDHDHLLGRLQHHSRDFR